MEFYQEPIKNNYNFCYINCQKNYLINYIDQLFKNKKATMFANQQKFIIHKPNKYCDTMKDNTNVSENSLIEDQILKFLNTTYPKNKYLPFVFKILVKKNVINDTLFFDHDHNIHIADFCAFINNRFGKKESTNPNMLKLCKYLQNKSVKFPKIAIKNPIAQNFLT